MSGGLRWLLLISVALAAGWAGYQAGQGEHRAGVDPAAGAAALTKLWQAPVTDLSGHSRSLTEWQGKLLVVNLWATWCPPCRAEMPAFSRIQQKFADKGVQFVGIALDSAEPVQAFLRLTPVSYPILLAPPSHLELTAPLGNGAQGLPFSFIVNSQGQLAAVRLGQWHEAELEAELLKLLPRQ